MTDIFDVLSDETRRTIMALLHDRGDDGDPELSVSEIVAATGHAQPAVSKQLKVLRDAGVVSVREDGQHRLYRLDVSSLADAEAWLTRVSGAGERNGRSERASSAPRFVIGWARAFGGALAEAAGKAPWR